jgi:hypothetical protein
MELLSPSLGLIIWTLVSFVSLGVIAYAIYHLANNGGVSFSEKLLWSIFILLIPIFGAIVYLGVRSNKNAKTTL